jgi:DNA-binding LacI/PurR family transcriptional regulator
MTDTTGKFEHLIEIREAEISLVFFDRICETIVSDRVVVDDEVGAYEAVKHLIKTGCKKIAHLSGPQNLMIGIGRKEGYVRALNEYKLPVIGKNIISCDTAEEARIIVPALLKRTSRSDGYERGKEAVKLLIARIEGKSGKAFQTKIIKTELVIKGSSLRQ